MGDFLKQEAGPLPYWAWLAIALGIALIIIAAVLIPSLVKKGDREQEEVGETSAADDNKSATEVKKEEKKEVKEEPAPVAEKPAEKKPAEEKPAAKKTTAKTTTAKSTTAAKTTTAKTTATKTAAKKEDKPAEKDEGSTVKVYHISKRKEDKKWQVKAEGADKALRLFFTQSDAIEYAKKVAGNQEGRIVVHKEGGGFRKLNY